MAPLNPNNTMRFFVDYSTGNVEHTALIRAIAPQSPADVGTQVDGLLTAISGQFCLITVNRVRFAPAGSDISAPVATGIEGNVYGSGAAGTLTQATSWNFVGRSGGGRRCRFSIFGYEGAPSDFRLTEAESTEVTAALAWLNGAANSWRAIDGLKPLWYPYADVSINAYWQRQLRS